MSDIDDDFDGEFADEDEDAKLADKAESQVKEKADSLEKRRLIDNLLEEKRLARVLKDDLDDDLDDDFDDLDDLDDEFDD